MKAYSKDLRERVVVAVEQKGWTWAQAAASFGVSIASVSRYLATHRAGQSLVPRRSPGRPRRLRLPEHMAALAEHLAAEPDMELADRCAHLARVEGLHLSASTLWRAMRALDFTRKKRR